jgi:hypothetical protein
MSPRKSHHQYVFHSKQNMRRLCVYDFFVDLLATRADLLPTGVLILPNADTFGVPFGVEVPCIVTFFAGVVGGVTSSSLLTTLAFPKSSVGSLFTMVAATLDAADEAFGFRDEGTFALVKPMIKKKPTRAVFLDHDIIGKESGEE